MHGMAAAVTTLLLLSSALPLGGIGDQDARSRADALRVLFIGNSLTYSNDLPGMIEALAAGTNQKPLVYRSIAFPNFALEDHWNAGDALEAIRNGGWDIVVMQQGPSASPEGRRMLLRDARRFAKEIRMRGARPALFMVWPSDARSSDFEAVSDSYSQAAGEAGGWLLPVGRAWLAAWRLDSKLPLYSSDGFHPGVAGSYLAALVIYTRIYDRSPLGLPSTLLLRSGKKIEIPADQARLLQEAAREVNEKFGR